MNKTKKMARQIEKCKSLGFSPIRGIANFEDALIKSPLYDSAKKIQNVEKELIKKFKTPFTPSKIQPNNDYYTYINYRWLEDTRVKMDKVAADQKYFVQVDDFRLLQDTVYKQLIDIVKEYIKTDHSRQAKQIKNVYSSLLKLEQPSLKQHILDMVNNFQYYVARDDLWGFLAHINSNEIISWACPISWKVLPDEKNSSVFRNYISFPQLSLYDTMLYFDDLPNDKAEDKRFKKKVKTRYFQYINEIFNACLGKNHGLKPKDVFDVEYDILISMGCSSVKNDSLEYYNIVNRGEALSKYGFDWEKFSHSLGYKTAPDFFICDSLNYLKCASALLKENWKTPKWKAYWFYIYLRQKIRFDHKLRKIYYDFNGKFLKGQPDIFPPNIYPVFGLSFTFNTFLTNQYVERYQDEDKIQYVRNIGNDLITVFKRIIGRNTWLSPKTKKYALLKLEHLNFEIAQPKNLRPDPLLDYSPVDAWGNMVKLCQWKKQKFVELNGKEVIDIPQIDWNLFKLVGKQSYIVNAFYTPAENSIYIPLAYIQKPFVDLDERGIEYNLAHVGYTLGHEMSHSLDEMGSKYDYKGNLHDWWTKEDKIKYKRIIKDIIKQYEVYAAYDGIEFNAEMSIGEDMADISGLAICEEYLRDFQLKNSDIVPISSLSFQAFFVYFAFQQRQHIYKKAFEAQLKTNPHPMDKYRTNVPLSRLELFRSLYNVKKGDKMWWHSTSTIW
jgi:putative endopeptidase